MKCNTSLYALLCLQACVLTPKFDLAQINFYCTYLFEIKTQTNFSQFSSFITFSQVFLHGKTTFFPLGYQGLLSSGKYTPMSSGYIDTMLEIYAIGNECMKTLCLKYMQMVREGLTEGPSSKLSNSLMEC